MSEFEQLSSATKAEIAELKRIKHRMRLNKHDPDYCDPEDYPGIEEEIERLENSGEV